MFLCGDADTKSLVAKLTEELGFEPVDCGPLSNAAMLESLARLWLFLAPSSEGGGTSASGLAPWGLDRLGDSIAIKTVRLNMKIVRWSTTVLLKASLGISMWPVHVGTAPARNIGSVIAFTTHAALTLENFLSIYFVGGGAYALISEMFRGDTSGLVQPTIAIFAGGLLWAGAHTVGRATQLGISRAPSASR